MLGTRRSVGQFIPQYRTDGQYDHTKTWACVRKAQSTETLRATPKVVPRGPTIMSAIPRGSRRARPGPVAQYRIAVVGAFGVPSVAKKAGNECPVTELQDLIFSGKPNL